MHHTLTILPKFKQYTIKLTETKKECSKSFGVLIFPTIFAAQTDKEKLEK
jgi:hypothetical protein